MALRKFLDQQGVSYLWSKVITKINEAEVRATGVANAAQGTANEAVSAAAEADRKAVAAQGTADTALANAATAQGEVDALETLVGTIPADAGVTDIVGYINKKTSGIATDAALSELQGKVNTIEGDYLKGADKTELEGKITAEETRALAAEKANADAIAAVKEDVDTFFKDADLTESAKDTLKEIQEYINSDVQGAAALTESINGVKDRVKAIEDDYLVEADKTELSNAIAGKVAQGDFDTLKGRVDGHDTAIAGKVAQGDFDALAGRVSTAEGKVTTLEGKMTTAEGKITTAEGKISTLEGQMSTVEGKVSTLEGKVDVEKVSTAIATAKQEAIAHADGLASNYDVAGAAAQALTDAKAFMAENYDTKGAAAQALVDAKAYVDSLDNEALTNTEIDQAIANATTNA